MMHLYLLGIALAVSILVRLFARPTEKPSEQVIEQVTAPCTEQAEAIPLAQLIWPSRWHSTLVVFGVPPLLLLTTAIAVIAMGYSTAHRWDGQLSYAISLGFVLAAIAVWLRLIWTAWKTWREIRCYPQSPIQIGSRTANRQQTGRILNVQAVFSAQVGLWSSGLWSSELVVSQGLLTHLDDEHLEAVLAHEAGHSHYRDTFWFFWLGCLRRLTSWLPYSESLWQELLLLREMRADRWATRSVDPLVLAESLMSVMTAPLMSESVCAGFSCAAPRSRLAQRIDALLCTEAGTIAPLGQASLNDEGQLGLMRHWQWASIVFALSPLLTIPFHH